MGKLFNSTDKDINLDNDEYFSFSKYPIIDLSNFNNLLNFYKKNIDLFNALYTSLILEKNYLERRKQKIKKKKNKDNDKK